jgi:hypothetical protein
VTEFFAKIIPGQANSFAILVFACTLVLSVLIPKFLIIPGGWLPVIFLSFFVKQESSTIIAMIRQWADGTGSFDIQAYRKIYLGIVSFPFGFK